MSDQSYLTWPFFDDKHRALAERLEKFAAPFKNTHAKNLKEEDALSKDFVQKLGEQGILNNSVAIKENAKLDVRSLCLTRDILGRHSSLLDFACAMQGLGSGPISLFGSPDQREQFLTKVAAGKYIAAFALSEKEAGSDVAALACRAEKKGGSYILNGTKTWISNAGIADFYVVFARTGEAPGAKGLSAFIVEASAPGLKVSERIEVTSPHPLGTLEFDNCSIPQNCLVGEPGQGFKIAMSTLDVFRSTVGAAALGFARRALEEALEWTKNRKLFGQELSQFQMTQDKIANMATEIDASALLVYRAAWVKDSGAERVTREAAMAKLYATESAQKVIDSAVQLFGGFGVVHDHIVERLYRDIRPLRIYEGTSEVQKIVISSQVLKS